MHRRLLAFLIALFCAHRALWAQHEPVDPRSRYERVILVVPMIGAGTLNDPKRPLFAPKPQDIDLAKHSGILAYAYQLTDDGHFAIVEFVAATPAPLAPFVSDGRVLAAFRKGSQKKIDIEAALKKLKKDFNFENFGVIMP